MTRRTMVPLSAVADARLSHGELRVLLALGGYADAKGENIWASAQTLAADARVTRSTFFRAVKRLAAMGYVTATPRFSPDGRQLTTMYALVYEVPLPAPVSDGGEGVTQMTREGPTQTRREGPTQMTPKLTSELPKKQEKKKKEPAPKKKKPGRPPKPAMTAPTPGEMEVVSRVWRTFPKRVDPAHDYVRARKAIVTLLRSGATAEDIEEAALLYAEDCRRDGRAAKYVKAMHNFYADDWWRLFRGEPEVRVDGLTREEWIRARMDVAVFDALANGVAEPDDDTPLPVGSTQDDPFETMDATP